MTEAEWLECTGPQKMLEFLEDKASDRKRRLFACACCQRIENILTDRGREAVVAAQRFADGSIDRNELHAAWAAVGFPKRDYRRLAASAARAASCSPDYDGTAHAAASAINAVMQKSSLYEMDVSRIVEREAQALLLRDIFGPLPFRSIPFNPAWLTWNDGTAQKIAQGIYDERAFDRIPILADALEEAGCTNADILNHCRQSGEHVRGCWVVDLLLGTE
ncbi:MAG TPA: hypothetical protein VH682_25780 [Gemmataceae bacterium]|jgi:hypothetical protein